MLYDLIQFYNSMFCTCNFFGGFVFFSFFLLEKILLDNWYNVGTAVCRNDCPSACH